MRVSPRQARPAVLTRSGSGTELKGAAHAEVSPLSLLLCEWPLSANPRTRMPGAQVLTLGPCFDCDLALRGSSDTGTRRLSSWSSTRRGRVATDFLGRGVHRWPRLHKGVVHHKATWTVPVNSRAMRAREQRLGQF